MAIKSKGFSADQPVMTMAVATITMTTSPTTIMMLPLPSVVVIATGYRTRDGSRRAAIEKGARFTKARPCAKRRGRRRIGGQKASNKT